MKATKPKKPKKRPRRKPPITKVPLVWIGVAVGVTVVVLMFIQTRPWPELRAEPVATRWYDYRIVNVYPHDPDAFTQGLVFRDGSLFESTGLNGRSSVRQVRLETGEVIRQHPVESQHFAEGLTDWGNRLIQLTWQSHMAFVYDATTFALQRTFSYQGEGWGLTHDQRRLIMSDGTSTLRFLDPETWKENGRLSVTEGGQPVARLNELEVVRGEIFANVWQTDHLVMIDPRSGHVTGRVDLRGLLSPADRLEPVDVLNGIAYDATHDRLFVTGKLWPRLFEIRLQPRR